ncbi:MAG: FHA domain-containing protein [Chloroflexota bacterium]
MAFGRLEVYYPDGRLETYMLVEDTISVGRADGNVIALDTENISRYHFSLTHTDGEVTITDLESANGTFVDGVSLEANTPHVLGDVEEILIGSLRIIFRQVDDSPTMMVETLEEETQRMEVGESELRVEIDHRNLKVWPAASSSAEISITNTADMTREFLIEIEGMPQEWLRLTRPEIELDPNETAYILLNIKPPRRSSTTPQHYQLTVRVTPMTDAVPAVELGLGVDVMTFSGFGMAIGKQAIEDDPVPVFLHNQGSGVMRFKVSAVDPKGELTFRLPNSLLELQAGQRLRVDLEARAKNPPLTGAPQTYPFIVQVQSQDASRFMAVSEGKTTLSARFPMWQLVAAAGISLSVILVAVVLLFGAFTTPEPIINDLAISSTEILQGDDLTLTIDADNAETFDILVNQIAVQQDVSGDDLPITIDTSELSGDITIEVIARNGSESVRSSISSSVTVPITVTSFSVSPDPLIANTVNTLTITWDVEGADTVRITGLSDFTNNLVQSSTEYASAYTLEGIGGIPTASLSLTLIAESETGETTEVDLTVPLVTPQCTALEEVTLHEGPDTLYQVVATVESETTMTVLAQDADAGWLRFLLPEGEIRAWGESELFACADNFELENLATEFNVPELPATSTTSPPADGELGTPAPAPTTSPRSNTGGDS